MNLNLILFVFVLFLTAGAIVRTRRLWSYEGFLVATLALGFVLFPASVGYLSAFLWLLLIGIPGVWVMRLGSALIFGDPRGTAPGAWWIERFHPQKVWRIRAALQRGIETIWAGERAAGEATLASLRHSYPEWAALIELERAAVAGDYPAVLRAAPAATRGRILEVSPFLRHLEALGEVGDLDALDREFLGFERGLRGDARSMARLILGVFHGEVEFVRHLLAGPCAAMPHERAQFWLATAYQASGELPRAEEILKPLMTSSPGEFSGRVQRRLQQPVALAAPMPVALAHIVGSAVLDEEQFGDNDRVRGPVTRMLLALILIVFVVEASFGAASSATTLFQLGAFSAGAVLIDGEWWRLVTALFLHAGLAHLVFNVLALYSLAPFVERSLGSLRFLLVYFGSGVGGLAIVTWATYAFELNDRIVVGASGAIMGLVGATGAILAHAARAQGSLVARERLRAVGTIIGLQIVFDILVPQTSASAHLLGAGLGFLLARFARRS